MNAVLENRTRPACPPTTPIVGLVSTIIPVFNRAVMIVDSVASVLAQTYRPIEIILVDDGSDDETPEVLAKLQRDFPDEVRVVTQPNAGPGAARNAGLAIARGEFIQYLDSDDRLHPDKFSVQVRQLRSDPAAGVCYCVTNRMDPTTGKMTAWAETDKVIDQLFPAFLPKRGWATLTPLWRKTVCDAIGPWKPLRMMEDWEHDLRAGLLGVRPVAVDQTLCTVIDHDQPRASGMVAGMTSDRVNSLFQAHRSVWYEMKRISKTDWDYVANFSRTMFWIARLCGERGLVSEAEAALDLTDEMTKLNSQPSATHLFRRIKRWLGWKGAVKTVQAIHQMRKVANR